MVLGKNPRKDVLRDYHSLLLNYRRDKWIPQTIQDLESIGFYIPPFKFDEQADAFSVPKILHDFIHEKDNLDVLVSYIQDIDPKFTPEEIRNQPIKFLNRYVYAIGRPAYVRRIEGFSVEDAIKLAETMNCRIFIAHPGGEYGYLSNAVLDYYVKKGIHGIEVRSYFNTPEQNAKFDKIAKKNNLIRSGGSDYHGKNGPFKIGMHDRPQNQLPEDILEELWFSLPD